MGSLMHPPTLWSVLILLLAACHPVTSGAPTPAAPDPVAVVAEADRLADGDLWPGFDPRTIPVAIFDGEQTTLFRHPAPPDGFSLLPGEEATWTYAGRHPVVVANTSAMLGGTLTATLMPAGPGATLRGRAGLLIHEAFHVFQRTHHPGWSANEMALFTYPVDNPDLLTLRRLETDALRRALRARDHAEAQCWGRTALALRNLRFEEMPPGSVEYERRTELNEGLATYVEHRATGSRDTAILSDDDYGPEEIRQRGYRSGVALARLLDRADPGWRAVLSGNDSLFLDVMLAGALGGVQPSAGPCAFTSEERARQAVRAAGEVAVLRASRAERRQAFLDAPGWRVIFEAGDTPLFPQGFDPLNLQVVAPGEVLHSRLLTLGNDRERIEVQGRSSLTMGAGEHPLFEGVRRLTITGLDAPPEIHETNGLASLRAAGVSAEWRVAVVVREGQRIMIRLGASP